jgi:hypothetical protein
MQALKPNIIEQEVFIHNKSLIETKKIDLFSKLSTWFNDTDLEVKTSGLTYREFCQGVISEAYSLNCISIVSESQEQCEQPFEINYREANGKGHMVTLSPVLDRFQIIAQIDKYSIPHVEFNGLNTLNYYVRPNTTVRIYFELDKSNSISESFKIINKINDFSSEIISELTINEKQVDCTSCDIQNPKIIELPTVDMEEEARKATDFKLKVPSKPCKQHPYILEYAVRIKNNGTQAKNFNIFNRSALTYPSYKFTFPYSATYSAGFYVEVTTDKGVFRYDVVGSITRDQLTDQLNLLGIGTWQLSTSISANIYTCFSLNYVINSLYYNSAVPSAPSIITQPNPISVIEGNNANFSIVASGDPVLSYQWQKNNIDILGETNTSLSLPTTFAMNGDTIRCVVTNPYGSTNSTNVILTVTSVVTITLNPVSQNVHETDSLTLSVAATSSSAPITYQWRKNTSIIIGANSSTYTINPLLITDAATYDCIVSNTHISATSNGAVIGVYHWVAKTSGSSDNILKVFGL